MFRPTVVLTCLFANQTWNHLYLFLTVILENTPDRYIIRLPRITNKIYHTNCSLTYHFRKGWCIKNGHIMLKLCWNIFTTSRETLMEGYQAKWNTPGSRWRHPMETFSALLAICAWNSPVNSPHIGQWRGAFMFSLIYAWINGWVNNREAGDLRFHRAYYDAIVMS